MLCDRVTGSSKIVRPAMMNQLKHVSVPVEVEKLWSQSVTPETETPGCFCLLRNGPQSYQAADLQSCSAPNPLSPLLQPA